MKAQKKMENNTLILLKLHKLYNLIKNNNDKKVIKRLINKRQNPFLVDFKNDFTNFEIGLARKYLNKIANIFIDKQTFYIEDYYKRNKHNIVWYDKNHWLYDNDDFNNLLLLRAQLFRQKGTSLYKSSLELLNIYSEEQIEIIINKYYKNDTSKH
jgi:hypothetical protein